MNLIFIGAPGVGKGTQATRLAERLSVPHISTGAMFRQATDEGTDLGKEVDGYVKRGALVPDELTTSIVIEALDKPEQAGGFILDGYPRNTSQAEALDALLNERGKEIDRVLYLTAPKDEIIERLLARGRDDDNEEVINHRLEVYRSETEPVLDFYRNKGLVMEINGVGDIDEVHERVFEAARVGAES